MRVFKLMWAGLRCLADRLLAGLVVGYNFAAGTRRSLPRWGLMQSTHPDHLTAPIGFDEAWKALAPNIRHWLMHLWRAEQAGG
jgi:hypothetical protein